MILNTHYSYKLALLSIVIFLTVLQKEIERRIQHMQENGRAIHEQMANSRSLMARERVRRSEEKLAYLLAEEERIAEQEKIKKRHEQQLQAQRDQEQEEKQKLEEYRRRKEKEELTKAVLIHRDQFVIKYRDLMTLSETCKDQQAFNVFFTAHDARIKDLIQRVKALDDKIRVIIEKKIKLFARECKNLRIFLLNIKSYLLTEKR